MFANAVVVSREQQAEGGRAGVRDVPGRLADLRRHPDRLRVELPPIADDAVRTDYLAKAPPTNRQAVFDALDAVILPPVIERQQEMQDAVTEELTEAAAGRKSPEEAVTAAAERVKKLL